jgi:hypothetical protein
VKVVVGDDNSLFRSLTILPENYSYYFVFIYLTSDAEGVLCCVE